MNTIHLQTAQSCWDSLDVLEKMSPIEKIRIKLEELDDRLNTPNLWSNPQSAATLMKERKKLSDTLEFRTQAKDDVELYLDIIQSEGEIGDKDFAQLFSLNAKLQGAVFEQMMQGEHDRSSAILSLVAGSGGLESCNFVQMLLRMYTRYCVASGYDVEILSMKESEEHSSECIDNVTIRISGGDGMALGWLKHENGVLRLIRRSPYSSSGARHTSFAAVSTLPDIEDEIDVKIEDNDIEITAQTAGGPGGQNSNRRHSAIRLKHLPTGINILVRTERDQLSNKKTALKMLKAQLYDLEMQKKNAEQNKMIEKQEVAGFSSQIRTWTLSPYSACVDHRSGYKSSNAEAVLDGDLKEMLEASLRKMA